MTDLWSRGWVEAHSIWRIIMGQFLAVGLTTEIEVRNPETEKDHPNISQIQEQMQHEFNFVPDIYTASEEESSYSFLLNEDIFYSQLPPLLKELYPLLYRDSKDYEGVLQKLAELPPSEWLQLAKCKSEWAFQFDVYGVPDYLYGSYGRKRRIHYEGILLSMEGKIIMETFGRQFAFLKYTMTRAFQQFDLAGALRLYITG